MRFPKPMEGVHFLGPPSRSLITIPIGTMELYFHSVRNQNRSPDLILVSFPFHEITRDRLSKKKKKERKGGRKEESEKHAIHEVVRILWKAWKRGTRVIIREGKRRSSARFGNIKRESQVAVHTILVVRLRPRQMESDVGRKLKSRARGGG